MSTNKHIIILVLAIATCITGIIWLNETEPAPAPVTPQHRLPFRRVDVPHDTTTIQAAPVGLTGDVVSAAPNTTADTANPWDRADWKDPLLDSAKRYSQKFDSIVSCWEYYRGIGDDYHRRQCAEKSNRAFRKETKFWNLWLAKYGLPIPHQMKNCCK